MDIRKIRFRVSGGFAGLVRGAEIDASELSSSERSALVKAVKNASTAAASDARDLQTYELEIIGDGTTHRLAFDEMHEPAGLDGLVQRLSARARPVTL